ncbi:MAG: hypothetical protein EOS65_06180 [Mesorhizobium sp.]|nr:hypothetical protein EN779_32465 [Mesorhizobium sp. M4B.F.Ca.ET.088.02.2.1]RWF31896.1 MAG: hypothetical protein EOS45_08835 [Mesorhizobium sp.]RWF43297.1 MAG: hypothetical protein EOS65_06180 [Mesorhizobium sp.]TIX16260.1 MAG: hypothetical protein E5V41_13775 [Mesorhizobium sp.]TIX39000.1 MAG: hypothetical protein E5V40_17810 [Mesorhizobium sp.]
MMPKSVKRFSDDIMLYFFDPESDDFRPNRPEIILRRPEFRRNLYDNRPLVNTLNPRRFLPRMRGNVWRCAPSAARARPDRRP